mmetsp:Transcript_22006/g.25443  ORF Transcript_22006/g.25443 Transcript_22006/m.25443 type:complete len:213 (+) Transcript_22006:460-1098(+)
MTMLPPASSFATIGKDLNNQQYPPSLQNENDTSRTPLNGSLIFEEGITIESNDLSAFNEMHHSLPRKVRVYQFILLLLFSTVLVLLYQLTLVRQRELSLLNDLQELRRDVKNYNALSLDTERCNAQSIFEVDNCYINLRTTAELGSCAKNIGGDLLLWYETNIQYIYTGWWDDLFNNDSAPTQGADEILKADNADDYEEYTKGWSLFTTDLF